MPYVWNWTWGFPVPDPDAQLSVGFGHRAGLEPGTPSLPSGSAGWQGWMHDFEDGAYSTSDPNFTFILTSAREFSD